MNSMVINKHKSQYQPYNIPALRTPIACKFECEATIIIILARNHGISFWEGWTVFLPLM